ncbi:MAG: hypothetical protein R6V56_03130 [Lentisphaeria bacterium]
MVAVLVGIAGAIIAGLIASAFIGGIVWPVVCGVIGFAVLTLLLNLWVRRRLQKIVNRVQNEIQQSQAAIQRKMNQLQNRGMTSAKGLQKQLEKQQEGAIREALTHLEEAEGLCKWNLFVKKQLDTMRGQLAYQIKDFDKADEYLQNSLNMDPMTVAMKMTRQYKKDNMEEVEKLYKKGKKRFKNEQGAIIYGLYSWILIKQDRIDEAISALNEGRDKTDNEVLEQNWNHLVNGKTRQFSNAGLGELWYALHLEKPKPAKVKQRRGKRR